MYALSSGGYKWVQCYVFLDFVVLGFLGSQSLYNFIVGPATSFPIQVHPFQISTTCKINELTTTFSPKATIEPNDLIGILYLVNIWEVPF
jgi:hypothetical protein